MLWGRSSGSHRPPAPLSPSAAEHPHSAWQWGDAPHPKPIGCRGGAVRKAPQLQLPQWHRGADGSHGVGRSTWIFPPPPPVPQFPPRPPTVPHNPSASSSGGRCGPHTATLWMGTAPSVAAGTSHTTQPSAKRPQEEHRGGNPNPKAPRGPPVGQWGGGAPPLPPRPAERRIPNAPPAPEGSTASRPPAWRRDGDTARTATERS